MNHEKLKIYYIKTKNGKIVGPCLYFDGRFCYKNNVSRIVNKDNIIETIKLYKDKDHSVCAIYFIAASKDNVIQAIKIGLAIDPPQRLRDLQSANHYELSMLAILLPPNSESEIHERFKKYNIRGEWYQFSEEIENFLNKNNYWRPEETAKSVSDEDIEYLKANGYKEEGTYAHDNLKNAINDLKEGKTKEEIVFYSSYGELFYALQESMKEEKDPIMIKMVANELIEFSDYLKEKN